MDDTSQRNLIGSASTVRPREFSDDSDFADHKIAFAAKYATARAVLDIGCVQHNPENYKSRYWVHKALKQVAAELVGLDYYKDGIDYLNERGFDIVFGDAQNFDLGRQFDVIFAGDIIEHLEDQNGFFECAKRHLRDDGVFLVTTPNPWFWRNTLKSALMDEVRANPEHTCWFCPQTLRQLAARHDMTVDRVTYGSRLLSDRMMPLPRRWKCSTFHAVLRKGPPR